MGAAINLPHRVVSWSFTSALGFRALFAPLLVEVHVESVRTRSRVTRICDTKQRLTLALSGSAGAILSVLMVGFSTLMY